MAKQTIAAKPNPGLVGRSNQKHLLFILLIAVSLLTLLGGLFSQLLTVNAQTTSPEAGINYADQTVGTQSASQTASFHNDQQYPMSVSASSDTPAEFIITGNNCGTLNPNTGCSVQVAFKPSHQGTSTGEIVFDYFYNDPNVTPDAVRGAKPAATVNGSNIVNLIGNGVAGGSPSPSTNPTTPTTTRTSTTNNCASGIQGYVLIDGQPGAGIVVNLSGQSTGSVTIGDGGYFYFNNLCKGDYQIALDYDHTKYKANDADTRQIKLDGVSGSRNNAFSLSTITSTTSPATTAAPTTAAPTTAPSGTTAAPTTPAVATTVPAQVPSCAVPGGTVLRVCTATTQQSGTHFALVIGVQAGDSPVNLNDTVIVNLPSGVTVNSATSAIGVVTTTSSNTVRWGSFSLNPKQSASLVLSIDAPAGNLTGSSLFVSGSFNRSQAFQQRIPGLPSLTDIFPAAVSTTGTGGQGGGVSVPSQVPSTGAGQGNSQDTPVAWLILAAIVVGGLGIFGLFLTNRPAKPSKKEQK